MSSTAALTLLYSGSFLQAGFLGLGALWLASYVGHGGFSGQQGYGGGGYGYSDYGGGGYGPPDYGYGSPHRRDGNSFWKSKDSPYSRSNYYRQKRSVELSEEEFTEEEHMLSFIREADSSGCTLRLVCELAAVKKNLQEDEKQILHLVRYGDPLYNSWHKGQGVSSESKALRPYKRAALYGKLFGSRCANRYRTCGYNAEQIMRLVREKYVR